MIEPGVGNVVEPVALAPRAKSRTQQTPRVAVKCVGARGEDAEGRSDRMGIFVLLLECAPGAGQFHVAILTVSRA